MPVKSNKNSQPFKLHIKDFVDQMTDQRIPMLTVRGKWMLGQTLYLEKRSSTQILFKNTPY